MLMHEPAHFIKTFVTDLDAALGKLKSTAKLTQLQRFWLGFCLTGMLLTNSVCWAKFERASLGEYKIAALSWMFREAKVAWHYLLLASILVSFRAARNYRRRAGLDESDRSRSKRTKRIHKAHKQKHKASGVTSTDKLSFYWLLVTQSSHYSGGFCFLHADPALTAWTKEDKRLKKQGMSKKDRPVIPVRNNAYPQKLSLLYDCCKHSRMTTATLKSKPF